MLHDLDARLSKAVEQKRLSKKLEQDLMSVGNELQEQSTQLASLSDQLEKEKVDVENLERTSLTALFYLVLGSREEQLDKERQEMLSAQLRYQQTKHHVEFLQQEQSSLRQQLQELTSVESEYESLLLEKENLLKESNQAVTRQLLDYSEQIADLESEAKEISEAVIAGKTVVQDLNKVLESLSSAEGWGVWDMLGGGFISTAIKHSRIDDARNCMYEIQAGMSRFKRELADVQKSIDLKIEIGELASFADFFFDGLIADWIVQSRIEESLEQSKQAKKVIAQAVAELEASKLNTESKIMDLQQKRELLIEHA